TTGSRSRRRPRTGGGLMRPRDDGRPATPPRDIEPNRQLRQSMIDAGIIRPGSVQDIALAVFKVPPDAPVLRLDDAGRAWAARDIAEAATSRGEREFSPRQTGRRHRRAA